MTALLFVAVQLVAAASPVCTTVQPSPAFVCHDGGWLPPGHPLLDQPTAESPTPHVAQPVLVPEFRVGHTYKRDATGALIHIIGFGVVKNGIAVLSTECLNEATQDQCFFPGQGRLIVANANALGWTEQP